MDDRLKDALAFSKLQTTIRIAKEQLQAKLDNDLTFAINGGLFKVNKELITFVDMLVRLEQAEVVLIDSNNNPIKITELEDFFYDILTCYTEATNKFLMESEALRKKRTVGAITE